MPRLFALWLKESIALLRDRHGLIALFITWQVLAFYFKARAKRREAALTPPPLPVAPLADRVPESGSAP